MHQFDLTEDQLQIQEMARKFTADAITPFAAEWDEKHIFPRDTIREAAELGFGAIYVSEESGGIGLGRLEAALIMEAMSYGCPSTSAFISIHNMASWMIDRFGSDDVKQKYLPSMIPMERIGSYCPDRTVVWLGRRGSQDQGGSGRRPLCRQRLQGVHLRRRRE
jgi:alkylation response protein AidB-like acyl-CoA dehydrogenase